MCKIRVIIKSVDSDILYDEIHEIETTVNPLDRPSYVEMVDNGRKILTFYYSGSQEKYVKKTLSDEISITYGSISGRISRYSTTHERVEGTDTFLVTRSLLKQEQSPRFQNNIREGLKLVESLLRLFLSLLSGKRGKIEQLHPRYEAIQKYDLEVESLV